MTSATVPPKDLATVYSDGIVAFIDVLGWSDLVAQSECDPSVVARLSGVLARVKERVGHIVQNKGYSYGAKAHQFSDAHFLTLTIDDETRVGPEYVALWCRLLAREYLKEGLLVRGGITIGRFFDDGWACFGPAVTRAYRLEQQVGDPMIIIDPSTRVQEIFLDHEQYGGATVNEKNLSELIAIGMNPLARTRDGRVFVDFLRTDVSTNARFRPHDVLSEAEVVTAVSEISQRTTSGLSARSKIEWFLTYANGAWRKRPGGPVEEIDFKPTGGMRRRLTRQQYALVSAPGA